MQYVLPVLLISVGALLAMFGFLLFLETRKTKNPMDRRDKKGNIVGSIFLIIIASALIMGGVSTWYSSKEIADAAEKQGLKVQSTTSQASASQEHQKKEQDIPPIKQTEVPDNVRKQQAEKSYKSFSQIQKSFDYIITAYQTEITDISNGNMGTFGYNDLDKLNQQTLDLFRSTQDMDISNQYVNYQELLLTSILYLQGSMQDLKSFVEDKKVSQYTEAQDFLNKSLEANRLANIGVKNQAVIDGYDPPRDK